MHPTFLLLTLAPLAQEDPSLLGAPLPRPVQEVGFDAPEHAAAAPRPAFVPGAPTWDAPESPVSLTPRVHDAGPKLDVGAAPLLSTSLRIRDRLTEVLVSEPGDGRVWARGRDFRASFGAEGFTFLPVFGKQSPQEFPVAFQVRSATVGDQNLPLGVDRVVRGEGQVRLDHSALDEVYHLSLDQVEQTFVFDTLPATGELVLDLAVATELAVLDRADGLYFVHPSFGHVAYGDAFVYDATGARIAISRTWTGDSIQLTVPAAFLANAVLPLTIDPPVTAFVSTFGANDDNRPDICYDGRQNQYWVVWQEYTSATNNDAYLTSFTTAGTQGSSFGVEITSDDWSDPKVAYHYGSNRLLVVASESAVTTGNGSIRGQLVDAAARSVIGAEFQISTCCFPKIHPDVGGNNWDSVSNSHFCVVWAFEAAAGNHNVQYRVVDWDGAFITGIETVESSADDTIHTTISESHGDANLFGDWWTIAWTRDTNADGLGTIEARRVVWNGNPAQGAGNFVVDAATNCAWPSVTSRFDSNLVATADRPSVVVYERDFPSGTGPGGRQASIYGRVVTDGAAYGENAISFLMEDFDGELDQRRPHIATDGSAWYMAYSEVWFVLPASSDYDVYYCSGHLTQTGTNAFMALAERHENLAFTGSSERFARVATVRDGIATSTSDDAAVIWVRLDGTNGGTLHGSTLEIPTVDISTRIAVGRQFCDANDNGGPATFGARSSWMWIDGDQTLTSIHNARCTNVTPNATGYLIGSRTTTNVNLAGGSAGRLCVGNAGRYVNAVQNSGTQRTFSTGINPLFIPSPVGFTAAAAGETWYFQYWHRDLISGNPTSNFSNACGIMFAP